MAHLPDEPMGDLSSQSERFRDIFLDACRLRLRSDVPIATSLSGGLDSSAVACAISEMGRRGAVDHAPEDWQRAFVACFPGTKVDERRYADQIIAHTGMRAHYCPVDDGAALKELEKVIFDLEVINTSPWVAPWANYRQMRRAGIRVSLDGHGADELLGGYPYYVERAIEEMYGPSFRFRRYLDLKRTLAGFAGGSVFGRRGLPKRGIVSDLFDLLKSSLMRLGIIERLRKFPALDRFRGNYILPIDRILPPRTGTNQLYEETADDRLADGTALQKALFSSFHGSILPTWLTCFDRASMAHGIEARMPFMDWRLVTFSFALPDESKIGGGYSKRVLRQAMKGLVPDPIRLRTDKIGFPAPLEEWSRGALRPWLLDISASSSFLEASAWNGKAARDVIEGALAGTSSIYSVWPVINAHVLQQRFRIARGAAC